MQKERRGQHTLSDQEQFLKENGKVVLEMDSENKPGQMVQNILESGRTTELSGKESSFM
jgi:hypothetical protein